MESGFNFKKRRHWQGFNQDAVSAFGRLPVLDSTIETAPGRPLIPSEIEQHTTHSSNAGRIGELGPQLLDESESDSCIGRTGHTDLSEAAAAEAADSPNPSVGSNLSTAHRAGVTVRQRANRRQGTGDLSQLSFVERMGAAGEDLENVLDNLNLLPSVGSDALEALEQQANDPYHDLQATHGQSTDDGGDGLPVTLAGMPVTTLETSSAPGAGVDASATIPAFQRVDKPDRFKLFGDLPPETDALVNQHFFAYVLRAWAFKFHVSRIAITALLALIWGYFGEYLGVNRLLLRFRGPIPHTANTLYDKSAKVTSVVGFKALEPKKIPLPPDDNIKGRWGQRYIVVHVPPDLRHNLALPLMNPDLSSPSTPFFYDPETRIPDGFVCACTWLSENETIARNERLARVDLSEEVKQYPGMDAADVTAIAVGCNLFVDSAQCFQSQTAAVTAALYRVTNLHPSVQEQPRGVVLGGTWIAPGVVSAAKVAEKDVSLNASSATLDRFALVVNQIYLEVIADPLRKALTGPALIVRASRLGLPSSFKTQVRTACVCIPRCSRP
jgi:hypothetical protein